MTIPGRDNDLDALPQLLRLVLEKAELVFAGAQVELPERRFATFGNTPPVDCEQLSVSLIQLYPGSPGSDPNEVARCDGPRTAVLIVQLVRCQPGPAARGGQPPTAAAITAAASLMARDSWILLDVAQAVDAAGWNTGVIASVDPLETQGGFGGAAMTLTLAVP